MTRSTNRPGPLISAGWRTNHWTTASLSDLVSSQRSKVFYEKVLPLKRKILSVVCLWHDPIEPNGRFVMIHDRILRFPEKMEKLLENKKKSLVVLNPRLDKDDFGYLIERIFMDERVTAYEDYEYHLSKEKSWIMTLVSSMTLIKPTVVLVEEKQRYLKNSWEDETVYGVLYHQQHCRRIGLSGPLKSSTTSNSNLHSRLMLQWMWKSWQTIKPQHRSKKERTKRPR